MNPEPKTVAHRTLRQNRAMHLWFSKVAQELNAGGYSVKQVLEKKIEIEWTQDLVKEALWRPVQKVTVRKNSTTKLRKSQEIDIVYDHLNRFLGENFGIYVEWPHFESEEAYVKATSL